VNMHIGQTYMFEVVSTRRRFFVSTRFRKSGTVCWRHDDTNLERQAKIRFDFLFR
jgi:hypothetical protein